MITVGVGRIGSFTKSVSLFSSSESSAASDPSELEEDEETFQGRALFLRSKLINGYAGSRKSGSRSFRLANWADPVRGASDPLVWFVF